MAKFKAYRIYNEDGKVQARLVETTLDELDSGEVVMQTAFSSVNYKDALAATGAGKIVRRFPCIGGVDASGTVISSTDSRFKEGDQIICTSYDLGVAHDGGYSEYLRVPAGWVVPLPKGMTLFEAMALGTAGYTAGLAVERMEHEGLRPTSGPVIVTGATGGVGSIAIDVLAGAGYNVVALTGKEAESGYLKRLGAKEVMLRGSLDLSKIRPLDKATWAGAVDNLGGDVLAWLASTMQIGGALASVGLAASHTLSTTVMPFILRGVSLLGVDSVNTPMALRQKVWQRLASDLKPRHLSDICATVTLEQLPAVFDKILRAQVRGRTVVKLAG
ncbi:MAG TPA: oxidoreductase [Burkholderiales bacterium]|nr:oxidoreductase [Burkholderiales bacterium]